MVTTVLQYLVIAAVIGLVVFGIAVVVFGRGEQMAPLSPRTSPTELPDDGMSADDIRTVRFAMALRGYRMSDVDWALERMADEVERLTARIAELSGVSTPDERDVSGAPARIVSADTQPGGRSHSESTIPTADSSIGATTGATTGSAGGVQS